MSQGDDLVRSQGSSVDHHLSLRSRVVHRSSASPAQNERTACAEIEIGARFDETAPRPTSGRRPHALAARSNLLTSSPPGTVPPESNAGSRTARSKSTANVGPCREARSRADAMTSSMPQSSIICIENEVSGAPPASAKPCRPTWAAGLRAGGFRSDGNGGCDLDNRKTAQILHGSAPDSDPTTTRTPDVRTQTTSDPIAAV